MVITKLKSRTYWKNTFETLFDFTSNIFKLFKSYTENKNYEKTYYNYWHN